MFMWQQANTAS